MSSDDSYLTDDSSIEVSNDPAELRMAEIQLHVALINGESVDDATKQIRMMQAEALMDNNVLSDSSESDDDEYDIPIATPRKKPRKALRVKTEHSHWYKLYLAPDKVQAIREEESNEDCKEGTIAYTFRMMFRVTMHIFDHLVDVATRDGWYDNEATDNAGRKVKDVRLLILGCLHMIGHDAKIRVVTTNTGVSRTTQKRFFDRWITKMSSLKDNYIYLPRDNDELRRITDDYQRVGFPGCVGSIDVVHVSWDRCPAELRNIYKGKEKFPCVGFQVVSSSRRFIQYVSKGFPGSLNDKTTVKYVDCVEDILSGKHWLGRCQWYTNKLDGGVGCFTGCYFICDGGYLEWPCLVSPLEEAGNKHLKRYKKALSATRKDVECTFGILKSRFVWLKNCNHERRSDTIHKVFVTACILHNLLLKEDGHLDKADPLMRGGEMERLRDSLGIGHTISMSAISEEDMRLIERGDYQTEWRRRIFYIAEHMAASRKQALRAASCLY